MLNVECFQEMNRPEKNTQHSKDRHLAQVE